MRAEDGGGALASSYRRGAGRPHRHIAATLPQADFFAAGLVVMAMLDEITSMSRDTVLGALTELMFRMLAEGVVEFGRLARATPIAVSIG